MVTVLQPLTTTVTCNGIPCTCIIMRSRYDIVPRNNNIITVSAVRVVVDVIITVTIIILFSRYYIDREFVVGNCRFQYIAIFSELGKIVNTIYDVIVE